jgi:protein-disulfide isomerase
MRPSLWWVAGAALFVVCSAGAAHAADTTVATIGSKNISQAELEKHVQARLVAIDQERYQALREGLDELVAKELFAQEAKARGITVEALEKTEIKDKVTDPAAADIKELYEVNKEDLGGESLENVRPRLVTFLRQMQEQKLQEALVAQLKGKHKTSIALRAPVVEVGTGGRPARGNPKAPVKIVEFSDYECPYCKKGEEAVAQVMKEYGDRVQLYYRDFPLPFHKNARNAALAANCASAQGKFWEYHGKLFAIDELSTEKMKATAGDLGLDQAKFNACFDNQEFKAAVDKDMEDGQSVGVTGTPTFFVNGRVLTGAQPFEAFKEVIEEELARANGSS